MHMQELGCGTLQISFITQVHSKHWQVETLEPSTVVLHHSVLMWGSGSPHRGWILRGISPILSLFNSLMVLATPVTTPFSYKTHHYSLLPPLTMVFTPALFQTIKEWCRLCILASTHMNTPVILLLPLFLVGNWPWKLISINGYLVVYPLKAIGYYTGYTSKYQGW